MELGVEPNQRNSEWFTPLHEAVKFSSLVVVKFLLDNEGNVNRKSRFVLFISLNNYCTIIFRIIIIKNKY